jgi:hypothetical protein
MLKVRIEGSFVGFGAVNMGITQNRSPYFHALFEIIIIHAIFTLDEMMQKTSQQQTNDP